jgi:hypothetical protein
MNMLTPILRGLALASEDIEQLAQTLVKSTNGYVDFRDAFAKLDSRDDRKTLADRLVALGADPDTVAKALVDAPIAGWRIDPTVIGLTAFSTLGTALGAFHGYRRNQSIGWAVTWGILGGLVPPITLAFALAQGFGKPLRRK